MFENRPLLGRAPRGLLAWICVGVRGESVTRCGSTEKSHWDCLGRDGRSQKKKSLFRAGDKKKRGGGKQKTKRPPIKIIVKIMKTNKASSSCTVDLDFWPCGQDCEMPMGLRNTPRRDISCKTFEMEEKERRKKKKEKDTVVGRHLAVSFFFLFLALRRELKDDELPY